MFGAGCLLSLFTVFFSSLFSHLFPFLSFLVSSLLSHTLQFESFFRALVSFIGEGAQLRD